jgi:hypothetical protein
MRLGRSLVAEIAMAWSLDAAMIRKSIVYGNFAFLPASWVPYAELMRLDRLSGFWASYCHYLIGLIYAANLCRLSAETRVPIEVGKASSSASFHMLSPFTPLGTSSQAALLSVSLTPYRYKYAQIRYKVRNLHEKLRILDILPLLILLLLPLSLPLPSFK